MEEQYTDRSKDPKHRNLSITRLILFIDSLVFFGLGLFCLFEPEKVQALVKLDAQTTTYLGYGFLAAFAATLIALKFIMKERR